MMTNATGTTPATRSVLVVQDELIIRMLLEDMLEEPGYVIAAQASRLDEAIEAAENATFDIAILDLNLNGLEALPVADLLAKRGKPYVFATGYGEQGLPMQYRQQLTLRKPFQLEGLRDTLARALAES